VSFDKIEIDRLIYDFFVDYERYPVVIVLPMVFIDEFPDEAYLLGLIPDVEIDTELEEHAFLDTELEKP